MPIGYLPDMFGHIAQMPQILQKAGIGRAVVWRGVPEAIDRNRFRWSAPDGSAVETEYLVGGYGNGAYLFDVPDRFGSKLAGYRTANAAFYGDRSFLAMYGTDHAVPSPRLADVVDAVNAGDNEIEVRLETLADYAARPETDDRPIPDWTGELRSGARANMLMGVTSARIDLRIASGRVEHLLERYTEPLAALHGGDWPERLLELAWRRMVDNSAHDSICGCSHDVVVAQVLTRYAESEQLGARHPQRRRTAHRVRGRARQLGGRQPVAVDADGHGHVRCIGAGRRRAHVLDGRDGRADPGDLTPGSGHRPAPVARRRVPGAAAASAARPRAVRSPAERRPHRSRRRDPDDHPPRRRRRRAARARRGRIGRRGLRRGSGGAEALWELVVLAPDRRQILVQVEVPPLGWATVETGVVGRAPAASVAPGRGDRPLPVERARDGDRGRGRDGAPERATAPS